VKAFYCYPDYAGLAASAKAGKVSAGMRWSSQAAINNPPMRMKPVVKKEGSDWIHMAENRRFVESIKLWCSIFPEYELSTRYIKLQ